MKYLRSCPVYLHEPSGSILRRVNTQVHYTTWQLKDSVTTLEASNHRDGYLCNYFSSATCTCTMQLSSSLVQVPGLSPHIRGWGLLSQIESYPGYLSGVPYELKNPHLTNASSNQVKNYQKCFNTITMAFIDAFTIILDTLNLGANPLSVCFGRVAVTSWRWLV